MMISDSGLLFWATLYSSVDAAAIAYTKQHGRIQM